MMPRSDIEAQLNNPENKETFVSPRVDGRRNARKTVASDKILGPLTDITVPATSVGQTQLKYETSTLVFGDADTVKTGAITSGSIIIGWYASAYTTPVASHLKLEISGTTLTGTLSAAPGAGNSLTVTVILLKI